MSRKKKWWPTKDPNAVLDYGVLWEPYLNKITDRITDSVWVVPDGITKSLAIWTETKTTIWLAGGQAGQIYKITNRITTQNGRVLDQVVHLPVREH
jgi:hypothetical protein